MLPMQRRNTIYILALLFALLTIPAFAGDETGQPAPRFRAKTMTGEQFNNESVKGKVVLFEFWTTWCKYCEEEAAAVDDIAKEFSAKGLIVLAVDVLEPDQRARNTWRTIRARCRSCSPKTRISPPCITPRAIPSMWSSTAMATSPPNSAARPVNEDCGGCSGARAWSRRTSAG